MPTRSEAFDAVAATHQNHYDIVSAVMLKHVPVVTGIVGMILVLAAGMLWDWWYKRSLRGRTDLSVPVPLEKHPAVIRRKEEEELQASIAEALADFARRLAAAGSDLGALKALGDEAERFSFRSTRARTAALLAARLDALGARDEAERFHLVAIENGRWEAQDVAARSARTLASRYAESGQKGEALTFARKALLLFEGAGEEAGIEETSHFIRDLRA